MNKPEINNERIKKLLEEDEDLRKANEKFGKKWKKEAEEEMIQEKIDWIYTLAELSNLKENERMR